MAARGKLPNLKICVDNTESTDESDVSLHDSGSYSSEDEQDRKFEDSKKSAGVREHELPEDDVLSIGETEPTVRKFLSRTAPAGRNHQNYGPKVYENKSGNFVTGIDVTSEEAQEMRDKRAQRFGTLSNPKHPITDVDIKNLYRSLGLSVDKLAEDPRGWRLEAILLRGTENMSTEDVFKYFSEFGPKGIEWIDDFSCNVLWADKLTPARALLRLSSTMDEVHLAEKIVDGETEGGEAASQTKSDKSQEEGTSEKNSSLSGTDAGTQDTSTNPQIQPKERDSVRLPEREKADTAVPAVLAEDEIAMELDFDDDEIDLNADDPIDQALSTWSNFTQDKERRAQRRASDAAAVKTREESEAARKGTAADAKEKGELEALSSAGEKQSKKLEKTSEKEKKASRVSEKDKDESRPAAAEEDNRSISRKKEGKEKGAKSQGQDKKKKRVANDDVEMKIKEEKVEKPKGKLKKAEKMETGGGGGGSDSDSSGSSSSSSSGSSSSSSGSGSDSDSSSGSSSSSSSSSSSGNSTEGSKKKKLKSRSERDKESSLKKTTKKPERPPALPQVKEKSEIPWPPGFWRLGMPCAKAEYLFMRYAMKADKKLPGAEKKSEYYKKYGNPNFGGITGLISNSRKRRLRHQANRGAEEDVFGDDSDPSRHDSATAGGKPSKSRLAGRLGVREGGKRAHSDDGEAEDDRSKVPTLREGKDLRDLLNGDPTAVKDESEVKPTHEPAQGKDSDDEMDYGAELERLMADDDEGPPIKKRFMRMHADDEEIKIKNKRLAKAAVRSPKWQKDRYEEERPAYDDDYGEEDEEQEEDEIRNPSLGERNLPASQGPRGYVDYDNVEDDDPFNLFGTAAPKETLPVSTTGGYNRVSDGSDEENDYEDRYYDRRSRFAVEDEDRRRDRQDSRRKNSWGEEGGGRAVGGGVDLRAKLQARRRAGNRNW